MLGQGLTGTDVKSGVCERTISNTTIRAGAISTKSCVGIKERRGHEVSCVTGFIPPTVLSARETGEYGCSGRLTVSVHHSRTRLARALHRHACRDGGMAGTGPMFIEKTVNGSPATELNETYHNMNVLRLHLMHRIHIIKSSDCTIDACLSRELHKTLHCLEVGMLVRSCHVCPFGTDLDLIRSA